MSGTRWLRRLTAAVVLAVAAFAAIVSYSHIYELGRVHGQAGVAARLLPLSVDGLILAASLVLLHEARSGRPAPVLARLMLWLGIAATVAANLAYGAAFGPLGALVSAWPAVAFIGSAEMAFGLVRRSRTAAGNVPDAAPDPGAALQLASAVPADLIEAAKASLRATLAAGNPLSANQLQERFTLTRAQAAKVRQAVLAESNGHSPE